MRDQANGMSTQTPLAPLNEHLEYWLRTAANHAAYVLSRRLREEGVTTAEWSLLRELYDVDDIMPNRLAKRLALTDSAVARLADRLVVKGLVVRDVNALDVRQHRLYLTQEGRAIVPTLAAHAEANEIKLFSHLSSDERRLVQQALKAIVEQRQG
ncbi:MarR family winged helix-turn-helix transcriptional regulator [Caulobacter segnis]